MVVTIKELADVLCLKEPRMKKEEAIDCAKTILDIFGYSNSTTDAALRASLSVHPQYTKVDDLANEIRGMFYHLVELQILSTQSLETTLPLSKKEYRIHYWQFRSDWNKINEPEQKQAPSEFACYDNVPEDVFKVHAAQARTIAL